MSPFKLRLWALIMRSRYRRLVDTLECNLFGHVFELDGLGYMDEDNMVHKYCTRCQKFRRYK